MADDRPVKLMSDYGAGWPLWTAQAGLTAPDTLALSASLTADLRAWQEMFEREFHWDHGWSTPEVEARYAQGASELLHRLRRELGPDVHLTLDTWPVSDPALVAWLKHHHELSP